jgi:hypothetical protein
MYVMYSKMFNLHTKGKVVEFPNRMSTVRSMLDQFVLLFDLHITQIMYASSRHIRYTFYVPSHIDSLWIDCGIKATQRARPNVPESRPTQRQQGARKRWLLGGWYTSGLIIIKQWYRPIDVIKRVYSILGRCIIVDLR